MVDDIFETIESQSSEYRWFQDHVNYGMEFYKKSW